MVRTAGVLFAAKQRGVIGAVRPPLDALRTAGFRLRKDVYEEILEAGRREPDRVVRLELRTGPRWW